ncbi:MAG: site-specific DNA-methyltransferase, partial [Gemmatimonadetes bacterium]|nr:site-specific DNA-methyltransferase [Gemmatimonadota bacterium]
MTVIVGDCREVMAGMEAGSVSAIVTDPPYDLTNRTPDVKGCEDCGRTLGGRDGKPVVCPRCGGKLSNQRSVQGRGFMGKEWDGTGVAFDVETWRAAYRVLKPGGHLAAFGGSRTYPEMAVAISQAGFERRDTLMWIYATGFPKSLDVSKAIDKAAGVTREVTSVARGHVPTEGGAFDDDAYEWQAEYERHDAPATDAAKQWEGWGTALKPAYEP